jgi:hypothetical protein
MADVTQAEADCDLNVSSGKLAACQQKQRDGCADRDP